MWGSTFQGFGACSGFKGSGLHDPYQHVAEARGNIMAAPLD